MLCSLMCLSCSVLSCSVLSSSVMFVEGAGVLFCCVMSCSVVSVEGARRETRGILGATWGLAAAVCRVGVAGRSVLKI